MRINVFNQTELRQASSIFCFEYCPMREFGECVLSPGTTGTICNVEYFLEKLLSGELKK